MTLKKAVEEIENGPQTLDRDVEEFFRLFWGRNGLPIDKSFVDQMVEKGSSNIETKGYLRDHLLSSVRQGVEELVQFSYKQTLQKRRLGPLLKAMERRSRKTGYKLDEDYNRTYLLHHLNESLDHPPRLCTRDDDCQGVLHTLSNEYLQIGGLIAVAPIFRDIGTGLRKRGQDTKMLRRLPAQFARASLATSAYNRFTVVLADLAYNKKKALHRMLVLLPSLDDRRSMVDYQFIGLDSLFDDPDIERYLGGFPKEIARKAVQGISNWDSHLDRRILGPETRDFYVRLMKHRIYRWSGLMGYLETLVNECNDPHAWREEAAELIDAHVPKILGIMGLEKRLADVDPKYIRLRLMSERSAEYRDYLGTDPLDILVMPRMLKTYSRAAKHIAKHFPGASLPEFDDLVSSSSFTYDMQGFEWLLARFSKSNPMAYSDPTFKELVSKAGARVFIPHPGRIMPLENLLPAAKELNALKDKIDGSHFHGLIYLISGMHDEMPEFISRMIKLLSEEQAWKKFGNQSTRTDARRKHLTYMMHNKEMSEAGLELLAAEHEVSIPLLESLADHYPWELAKREIPFSSFWHLSFRYTPLDTYRTFRLIAASPDFFRFVGSLVKNFGDYDARKERNGGPGEVYAFYSGIERALEPSLGPVHERELKTITALEAEMQRYGEDISKFRARQKKAIRICAPVVNRTIRKVWDRAYTFGLENITGLKLAYEDMDEQLKNAVAVYYVSNNYPGLQAHLKNLLLENVRGKPYSYLSESKNVQYLKSLQGKGFDTRPWTDGFQLDFHLSNDSDVLERRIRDHEWEIRAIYRKYGINITDPEAPDIYDRVAAQTDDPDELADIRTQLEAIRSLKNVEGIQPVDVKIYLELDPMKAMQMGQLVDGSCLAVGKGNTFSVIANAIDQNKRVVYAATDKGIVGRELIAVSDEDRLVHYRTYNKGNLDLDKPYELFIEQLGKAMNMPLAHSGHVKTILAERWYDDGTRPFLHVKAGGRSKRSHTSTRRLPSAS
jgi:hypothetical protein